MSNHVGDAKSVSDAIKEAIQSKIEKRLDDFDTINYFLSLNVNYSRLNEEDISKIKDLLRKDELYAASIASKVIIEIGQPRNGVFLDDLNKANDLYICNPMGHQLIFSDFRSSDYGRALNSIVGNSALPKLDCKGLTVADYRNFFSN